MIYSTKPIRCRQFNFSQVNEHHEFRRNMLFISMSEMRDWEGTVFCHYRKKIKYFCLCNINEFFCKNTHELMRFLTLISLSHLKDPVSGGYGSPTPPTQRHLPSAQHVVPDSAADDTICCVISLTCDAPRRGGKQRYDYFLSVIHFRKVVIFRKVGSDGSGSPVI